MHAVICTADSDWSAPLAALLRERRIEATVERRVEDAVSAFDTPRLRDTTATLILHAALGRDDVASAIAAVERRFGLRVAVIVVGPIGPSAVGRATYIASAFAYTAIVSAVVASAGARPSPAVDSTSASDIAAGGAPIDAAELSRLLRLARTAPYPALLGVDDSAPPQRVSEAAAALLRRLAVGALPSHVEESAHADLTEVRAAVVDARDVLSSARARAALCARSPSHAPLPARAG